MILCWIGIHRWRWVFVGSSWQPDDYVRACTRCGMEHPNPKPHIIGSAPEGG